MRHVGMLALLTLMAAGCAGMEAEVRTLAARDFSCSEDQLQIVDQEQSVFRIAGCGEVATYVCHESRALRRDCQRADWDTSDRAARN